MSPELALVDRRVADHARALLPDPKDTLSALGRQRQATPEVRAVFGRFKPAQLPDDPVAAARSRIMEYGVAAEFSTETSRRRMSRGVTLIPTLCAASSVAMLVADLHLVI